MPAHVLGLLHLSNCEPKKILLCIIYPVFYAFTAAENGLR